MIQLNPLLFTFLVAFVLRSAASLVLNGLNITYLRSKGGDVPEPFREVIDPEKLKTMSAYTVDSVRVGVVATLVYQAIVLLILLSGILPGWVDLVRSWGWGVIAEGLLFFGVLAVVTNLARLPFSLYDTFVIEARYGFNTLTFKTWILDLVKSLIVVSFLGGLVLGLVLWLMVQGGKIWWLWAWILLGLFELLMLWLFPVIIAPLFNQFEPMENNPLVDQIKTLMGTVGLRVKGVFRMDASKRSKHTNAYFTGVGRTKRIVLFDTLLESHTSEEILAVLSHEVGHWKKQHILKHLIFLEGLSLVLLYAVARLLDWPPLYETFGFHEPAPYVGLFLIGTWISAIGYFVQPVESAISRKFEREADDFAVALMKKSDPMRSALKRLAVDNLSNLTPHPLYTWFYDGHPPLAERISRLKDIEPV